MKGKADIIHKYLSLCRVIGHQSKKWLTDITEKIELEMHPEPKPNDNDKRKILRTLKENEFVSWLGDMFARRRLVSA